MPVKMTSRIHNKDKAAMEVPLRDLCPDKINRNAPLIATPGIRPRKDTMQAAGIELSAWVRD